MYAMYTPDHLQLYNLEMQLRYYRVVIWCLFTLIELVIVFAKIIVSMRSREQILLNHFVLAVEKYIHILQTQCCFWGIVVASIHNKHHTFFLFVRTNSYCLNNRKKRKKRKPIRFSINFCYCHRKMYSNGFNWFIIIDKRTYIGEERKREIKSIRNLISEKIKYKMCS